ncbi:MAG: outer membrane beta-barrel protein [Sulfuricaulis sp.]
MIFRKTALITATLAACSSLALADEKIPTLGEIFKASGLSVDGYIDFSHNDLSTSPGSNTYRVFDTERRGFNLQMLDLRASYLPADGYGGLAELNYGSDAQVIHSFGTSGFTGSNATATSSFDVSQAYLQYAAGPFSVQAGKFVTLAGAEVIRSPDDTNFSRSYLFGFAIPFTHTGVRANYAPSDAYKFTLGLNNGWDVAKKSGEVAAANGQTANGSTVEVGASANPAKWVSLSGAYYNGSESIGTTTPGIRDVLDLVATFNVSDALNFVLNYDNGKQEHGAIGGGDAKWNGLAGYANYQFTDQWRLSFRTEKFDDQNGYRTGTTQTLKENTLTVAYLPAKSMELRAEYRKDKSDKNVFTESGSLKSTQDSVGLEALYKF